jgi:hypothetical protein
MRAAASSFFGEGADRVKPRFAEAAAVVPHTEKFSSARPWFTWPTVHQEIGATYVYQRQWVRLL